MIWRGEIVLLICMIWMIGLWFCVRDEGCLNFVGVEDSLIWNDELCRIVEDEILVELVDVFEVVDDFEFG